MPELKKWLRVGFIWILVQESKTTNRHFEKWHESDMKGIIYMKHPSSDFQNAIKNKSLQYCTKNWTPYCWFVFLMHYIFTCLWVKHWHTVIREPLWGGTPVITQKTQLTVHHVKSNIIDFSIYLNTSNLMWTLRHGNMQVQSQQLALHLDPTACQLLLSSLQWVDR